MIFVVICIICWLVGAAVVTDHWRKADEISTDELIQEFLLVGFVIPSIVITLLVLK